LETIEEIGMRGKETFINAGGNDFQMIPCLNTHQKWIAALTSLIQQKLR
jgi:ferrochelatase